MDGQLETGSAGGGSDVTPPSPFALLWAILDGRHLHTSVWVLLIPTGSILKDLIGLNDHLMLPSITDPYRSVVHL